MTNEVNFDALTIKADQSNGAMEDLIILYGAAFALSEWHFISRGEMPNVSPYIASNAQYADGQPMIRAFTDTKRLLRFAQENNLTEADGSCKSLSIPTEKIVDYLEQFIADGTYGIWFNSDTQSEGFFVPLNQLRPIKEHLDKLNPPKNDVPNQAVETLLLVIKEGLIMPSTVVRETPYLLNLFWRVPPDWVEDRQIKKEYFAKIDEQLLKDDRRSENIPGAMYIIIDIQTKLFTPETVKATEWRGIVDDKVNLYQFFIASESGEIKRVTAEEFQADVDASFQSKSKEPEQPRQSSNLESWGLSASPGAEIDLNSNLFQKGAVNFDTSIAPFYQAIFPLLEDYRGSGEYINLLSLDENVMHEKVENIASNSHGACLRIRRFLYPPDGSGMGVGINTIDSSELRHIQTQSSLLVNFALVKNIANQTASLYYRFQGPKSEVSKLQAAVSPLLASCGFKASS